MAQDLRQARDQWSKNNRQKLVKPGATCRPMGHGSLYPKAYSCTAWCRMDAACILFHLPRHPRATLQMSSVYRRRNGPPRPHPGSERSSSTADTNTKQGESGRGRVLRRQTGEVAPAANAVHRRREGSMMDKHARPAATCPSTASLPMTSRSTRAWCSAPSPTLLSSPAAW